MCSAGKLGIAVSLLILFTLSFFLMKYQQNENSVHVSAPVRPAGVRTHVTFKACRPVSAQMRWHGCLLSNLTVISLCACLSAHAQVCTLVHILIHLDFVPS